MAIASLFVFAGECHAVEAVEDRLTGRLGPGSGVTLAGHRIDVSGEDRQHRVGRSDAAPVTGLGGIGQAAAGFDRSDRFQGGSWGDLLARSSFHFSSDARRAGYTVGTAENGAVEEADGGGDRWSVWGRGATTRLSGGGDTLDLDGDVTTGTVGADFQAGRVLFGVAASHSRGSGGYRRD